MKVKDLSTLLAGRVISHVTVSDSTGVNVYFNDESAMVIELTSQGIAVSVRDPSRPKAPRSKDQPTPRQREYLDFICRYMARRGWSPAEADIQGHFMVSAPSVHEMVKTLERRGFITRDRDLFGQVLPRSIRVVIDSF